MTFDLLDGRQEARALQTITIEIIRRNVRGGHQRNAAFKQRFHQRAQQHRIGDIGDKKFIKTEDVRFCFESVRNNQ